MQPPLAPIAVQPVWAQPEAPQPVPRPLAGSNEPLAVAFDDSGPTTLVDRGALRDHAARVATATPSVSAASAEAYAAKVKALATGPGVDGPVPAPSGAAPQQWPSNPPPAAQASAPPAAALESTSEKAAKPPSRLVAEWRRASWVMRLMIVLFPLGAYVSIWTPGEDDPITMLIRRFRPPAVAVKTKHPSPAKSHGAAHPVASTASSALVASGSGAASAAASSAPVPAASAVAPEALASARAAGPQASSGTPSALASAEPSIAVLGANTKKGAARTGGNMPAGREGDEAPRDVVSERAAIDAAFEGRVGEAASLYDRLAKGPNAPVFVLAARLVRADAVRKPAISH